MSWRVFALILAGCLGIVALSAADSAPPIITEVQQRPVAIASLPCAHSLQSTSSGFVIDDDTIVTVAHAVYESRDFAVRDATGQWHDASIHYLDLERDLAILRVDNLPATPMSIRAATRGDIVTMLDGAASGSIEGDVMRRVRISTEIIGDLSQVSKRSGYELSVEIKGGDSGAAVVDAEGNLAGVIFARSTQREASWATSVTEVESILDRKGVPDWECERPSEATLVLEPLEAEPARLAPG